MAGGVVNDCSHGREQVTHGQEVCLWNPGLYQISAGAPWRFVTMFHYRLITCIIVLSLSSCVFYYHNDCTLCTGVVYYSNYGATLHGDDWIPLDIQSGGCGKFTVHSLNIEAMINSVDIDDTM